MMGKTQKDATGAMLDKLFSLLDGAQPADFGKITSKLLESLSPVLIADFTAWVAKFDEVTIDAMTHKENHEAVKARNDLSNQMTAHIEELLANNTVSNADLVLLELVKRMKEVNNDFLGNLHYAALADAAGQKPKIEKQPNGQFKVTANLIR